MADYRPRPAAGRPPVSRSLGTPVAARDSGGTTNLADLLERVLDKGIVIAGDIQINLLDIELLTIKIRLLVASVDRAKEMGINWWETDPALSVPKQLAEGGRQQLGSGDDELHRRLQRLERQAGLEPAERDERRKAEDARIDPDQLERAAERLERGGRQLQQGSDRLASENEELRRRIYELEARVGDEAGADEPAGRSEPRGEQRGGGTERRDELSELTVDELNERAKQAGVTGYSSMRKSELIDAVAEAEASAGGG